MRIAVLGAPGAGKSKLARAIAKEYELTLVDNYVQRLQKSTGLALGPWSSYSEHIMVAGHRLAAEEKAGSNNRVTVGTIVDSITYAAVKSDVAMSANREQIQALYASAQSAMAGLSLMYSETWDYDLAFVLPYSVEEKTEKRGTWEYALDMGYLPVLESYDVPSTFAIEGDHEQRLLIVKDLIDLLQAQAAEEPNETEATSSD